MGVHPKVEIYSKLSSDLIKVIEDMSKKRKASLEAHHSRDSRGGGHQFHTRRGRGDWPEAGEPASKRHCGGLGPRGS